MKNYLIVGQGLAGTAIANRLLKTGKSFDLIDLPKKSSSSKLASGLWNPIVLKRMKWVWKGEEMMEELPSYYAALERLTNSDFVHKENIYRVFSSLEEQNNWHALTDNPLFRKFLDPKILSGDELVVNAPHGLGRVLHTGWIETEKMLEAFAKILLEKRSLIQDDFYYSQLTHEGDFWIYNNQRYSRVIFCEGYLAGSENPWFNYLPFSPTKGETLLVSKGGSPLEEIIHKGHFLLPQKDGTYKAGATYNWNEVNEDTTEKSKEELFQHVHSIQKAHWSIIDQRAGVRPNVKDRRPLIGQHPKEKSLYIFNGLGSRGVLITPWLSKVFVEFLENNGSLPAEADIKRYESLLDLS